ncbi:MAG: GH25 family lysozyme, partial [Candidatus Onthomonas sp.]|nr:GH25 family lysozyme [Candidatus Onthomonas sp.]
MHIRKRTLSLLLVLILAVTALPAAVLATDTSDTSMDTVETVEPTDTDGTSEPTEASNPTTDAEIQAALETYDASIDDPEYQRAYEAHQKWLEQQDSPQTFASGANPYTGKTYTHKHEKTNYIYDGIDVSKWQGTSDWKKVKADGIDFAFVRCGNTSLSSFTMNTDSKFAENVKNAYAAGIKVGVYYYSGATS